MFVLVLFLRPEEERGRLATGMEWNIIQPSACAGRAGRGGITGAQLVGSFIHCHSMMVVFFFFFFTSQRTNA